MDKTEKRTADGKLTSDELAAIWIDGLTPGCTDNSLNKARLASDLKEFAAQELDAYKARLKKRIRDWNSTSIEEVPPSYSWKDIFELIDTI